MTRVASEAMIQSQRLGLAAPSRPQASDRPSPFAELLDDPSGRQPAPDQEQITPRNPTVPLRNPTGPRLVRPDSRPEHEAGKDWETRTPETSPPDAGTPVATAAADTGADTDKDQPDKDLAQDAEQATTNADTVAANDVVAGLVVPAIDVAPPADRANVPGPESDAVVPPVGETKGKGAATGLLAQADVEIAGAAGSADNVDADEATTGKPAAAAATAAELER